MKRRDKGPERDRKVGKAARIVSTKKVPAELRKKGSIGWVEEKNSPNGGKKG